VEFPVTSQLALLLLLTSPASPEMLDSLGHAPPAMVTRLSQECLRKEYTRITTPDSARYLVHVGRIDEKGLGKFRKRGSALRPPDPLPWPYVARIDAVRSRRQLGVAAGAVAGGLIGWPLGSVGLGALAGGWIGGGVGSLVVHEKLLYVAQPRTGAQLALDPGAAGAAASAPAPAASAQDEGAPGTMSEPDAARVEKASAYIRANHLLRVTFTDLSRIEGKAAGADEAGLRALEPTRDSGSIPRPPDVIPWTRILQVERHVGSSGKGALIGGSSLALAGAIMGAAVVAGGGIGGTGSGSGGEILGGLALGALSGGAIGALLGAAIGTPFPRWSIVY
jgi:hypothetical protein